MNIAGTSNIKMMNVSNTVQRYLSQPETPSNMKVPSQSFAAQADFEGPCLKCDMQKVSAGTQTNLEVVSLAQVTGKDKTYIMLSL